jgi:small-conductance mechanosensitive channel
MPLVVPAIASMLGAAVLAAMARRLYRSNDPQVPSRSRNPSAWVAIFALLAGVLCILSIFLWFRYFVMDYLSHLGGSFD